MTALAGGQTVPAFPLDLDLPVPVTSPAGAGSLSTGGRAQPLPVADVAGGGADANQEGEACEAPASPLDHPRWEPPGRSGDAVRAIGLLCAIGADQHDVRYCVIDGPPVSKSRARYDKRGFAYTPPKDRKAEKHTADLLRRMLNGAPQYEGNVAIACIFFRQNRQRIDVDNLMKHVCDSATGVLWPDDSQVTAIVGLLELDVEKPRTLFAIAHHTTTLTRGIDAVLVCEHCGREYPRPPGVTSARRYCTQRCARVAINGVDLADPVPCRRCGAAFRRKVSTQVYCGTDCSQADIVGRPRPKSAPRRTCIECGTQLGGNRRGARRCRSCFLANPRGEQPGQIALDVHGDD